MQKSYLSADQLLRDAVELGIKTVASGFRPDLVIGIWRGGTPVAITVHEVLELAGIHCDHIPIRTTSYTGIGTRTTVKVYGLDYLRSHAASASSLLIVDDVFDTGLSIAQLLTELQDVYTSSTPDVRIAVPYYKPTRNQTSRKPDYYLLETADWLVFPHELVDLDAAELRAKPGLQDLVPRLLQLRDLHSDKGNPSER